MWMTNLKLFAICKFPWPVRIKGIFCVLRNTRSKLVNILAFPLAYAWLHSKYLFFDTFLKQQTNLKSMFSALSVKLCWNEEILDGTPKRKWRLKFSNLCLYIAVYKYGVDYTASLIIVFVNWQFLTIILCFANPRYILLTPDTFC